FSVFFFFSSRRRHTRWPRDWSSDVCSSDLELGCARVRDLAGGGVELEDGRAQRSDAFVAHDLPRGPLAGIGARLHLGVAGVGERSEERRRERVWGGGVAGGGQKKEGGAGGW